MTPDDMIADSIAQGIKQLCAENGIEQDFSSELIPHDCPVEGLMSIERGKPCNWCTEYDAPRPRWVTRYNKYVELGYGELRAQQQADFDCEVRK